MVVMLLKHMPFPLEATSLIDVLQGSQILNGGNQTLIDALPINVVVLKCIYFWWSLRDILYNLLEAIMVMNRDINVVQRM